MKNWPNKNKREEAEISEFIKAYKSLRLGHDFAIENNDCEKPDVIVKDKKTNELFGIELTSVYLDDRSVPDVHQKDHIINIPYELETIKNYKERVKKTILEKIEKARKGYDISLPLILSIYANEYITIHMDKEDWDDFANENSELWDSMRPFLEVVIWSLKDGGIFSIKNKQITTQSSGR